MDNTEWGYGFTSPPQSYWMASVAFDDYKPLENDIIVDSVVVGGGIVGITTAFLLSQEGLKVALVEADKLLHGATGHTTAKLTAQHDIIYNTIETKMSLDLARQYAEANQTAIKTVVELVSRLNINCDLIAQPAYVYTQDDNYVSKIYDEALTASKLGFEVQCLDEIPLPIRVKAALRFDNQYQFHPLKYLIALAREITANGSYIFEHTRAIDIHTEKWLGVLTSNGHVIKASSVVIASHYPFYDGYGMYFSRIYPERSYALGITIEGKYPGGMYITAEDPGRSFRSQPLGSGEELVIVGGEHHKTGQGGDTGVHYKNLLNAAQSIFKVKEVRYRWSTQDYTTMDKVPYVGNLTSKTAGIYVATGFRKWGMSNGTAAAMILKDLILGKDNPWYEVYNPSRFNPAASVGKFAAENVNVAKELIKGKLAPVTNEEISPGQAGYIEIDGEKYGAYRDMQGRLHVVDTTCTHLGCELVWNSAEHSWDCPCHGSRFTYEGEIIEGPAQKTLNRPEFIEDNVTDE